MQEDDLKSYKIVFCAWGLNTLELFIWTTRADFLSM